MIQGIRRFPVQYAVIPSRGIKGNYLFATWTQMWLQKETKTIQGNVQVSLLTQPGYGWAGAVLPWISGIPEATKPRQGDPCSSTATSSHTAITAAAAAASAVQGKANIRDPTLIIKKEVMLDAYCKVQR